MLPTILLAFSCQTQSVRPAAPPAEEDRDGGYLYYDYLENGELRGGKVPIDANNPLHADTGEVHRGLASPVTTLVYNGPPANRIDLVFVGDGYTAGQLGTYAADVDAIWPVFLAEPPLSEYATFFNVHRVDVTSPQSGVDNDPNQGIQRNTALDMGYWCSGIQRLLCVNVGKANAQAAFAPDRDTVLALANSGTYGGAGYTDLGTVAGHNGAAIEIALHEFGHSFARLADEYEYGGSSTFSGPEPDEKNVSIHDEAELVALQHKWVLWLDLPNVSAFEGGMYSQFGIYRPTFNSKMRNLGPGFEQFNSERFVRFIYGTVRPIDDATPAGTYAYDADFFVDPVDPVTHALDVQWKLDGADIPGATATTFDAGTLGLSSGKHDLSVEVVDNTPLVRSLGVRDNWMTEERTWRLEGPKTLELGTRKRPYGGPPPTLGLVVSPGPTRTLGGVLAFELEAAPGSVRPGAVPLLFLSSAAIEPAELLRDGGAGLLARVTGAPWDGSGSGARLEVAVPSTSALANRRFVARGAYFHASAAPGQRLVWTEARELCLED